VQSIKEYNLEQFIAECREQVERKLDELVPGAEVEPKRLHAAVRWSLFAGGKRFRPVLMLAAGKTFAAPPQKLLRTAAAVEMIHTYSLIHDDLPAMDDDDLRRGRETCHKKFDEATAILAGDVLQTLAFQSVAEDEGLSPEIRVRLISEISRAAGTPDGMAAGQVFDLAAESQFVDGAGLENIHASKTGALIAAAARSGAIIAGAGESEIEIISEYASLLGLLFQITDDLLDVTAGAATLGKTPGKDEKAKKATYISLYGVEKTREMAQEVYAETRGRLETLDREIFLLHEIADYILRREN
jgi:geranylgeranyl pyrophosphate synthase